MQNPGRFNALHGAPKSSGAAAHSQLPGTTPPQKRRSAPRTAHLHCPQTLGTCDPQLSRTSNSPLWAFITVKDLLAASGQILVAANTRRMQFRQTAPSHSTSMWSSDGWGFAPAEWCGPTSPA